jgi:uncharacterized DUF497 family protein
MLIWCTLNVSANLNGFRGTWNHIDRHGISTREAEYVVNTARRPYPQRTDNDKFLVWGATFAGEHLQVVYAIEPDDRVFVIHARPLTDREKRRYRRRSQ